MAAPFFSHKSTEAMSYFEDYLAMFPVEEYIVKCYHNDELS